MAGDLFLFDIDFNKNKTAKEKMDKMILTKSCCFEN